MKIRNGARKAARMLSCLAVASGAVSPAQGQDQHPPSQAKPATAHTQAAQRAAAASLPRLLPEALADARRGLVAEFGTKPVLNASNRPVWSLAGYEFLAAEQAPDTVHPGLWHHARLNLHSGLFKVTDRVYQVRGADIANMTILEGDTGVIVVDPLLSDETSRAAMELYFRHRPVRPVVAVIYTHSHADHFGGVRGVIDEEDVLAGKIRVIAPVGFMDAAIGENVMAGPVMLRRGHYQFGGLLPRSAREQVDSGLGKSISRGNVTLIAPTQIISQERETHRIDGVDIVFQLTPDSEAPSEMIMFYPQSRVLNMAELASQNMHNLLPVRGAMVRDALAWSKQIGNALRAYGEQADTMITQHHWPVWGRENVQGFLVRQRDMYKFLHDQTVRSMNHGLVPGDIAEQIELPASLRKDWATHGFYGSVKHNVKAVYQRYVGWYDGNPANLDSLAPVAEARKAVEYMGGAQAALAKARADFERGEYRWVAKVASQLVFADAGNVEARQLGADALEQLGYQSESSTMRNSYLQAARELRLGLPALPPGSAGRLDIVRALPLELYFDYLGVRLNGTRAADLRQVFNWRFTDLGQTYVLELSNGALSAFQGDPDSRADVDLSLSRKTLDHISTGQTTFQNAVASGEIRITRGRDEFLKFVEMLDTFPTVFPIVEPRSARAH